METETKTQESQYTRSLIESSLDPLVTISTEGKILDMNEAFAKVTGVSRENLIGTNFSIYFTEPDKAQEGYKQVFEKGFVADYPLTIKNVNGELTEVLYNASVYTDDKGNILGVFAAAREVTESKKNEEALISKPKQIIEGQPMAHIGSWEWDVLANKIKWSDELYRIYGLIPQEFEVSYDNMIMYNHPDDREYVNGRVEQALKDHQPYNFFHRIIRPDGTIRILSAKGDVFTDDSGNPIRLAGTKHDITEIKLASQYARSLIEASLDPLVTISADGKITDVNKASVKVTGVQYEKLIGTDFSNYFTEPQKAREVYEDVFAKGSVTDSPLTLRHKDGSLTAVLFNGSVYKDDNGDVMGVVVVARDITEQKRFETELIEAKRNAERATQKAKESTKLKEAFLANMSHEIRTPINAIIGFSDVLSRRKLGEQENEYVETIKSAGENLLTIINDILDTSKIEAGMLTLEEINFSVKETFKLLNEMLIGKAKEKNLELLFSCDKNVPDVLLGDQIHLTQIIINLAGNAIKFTQKGKVQVNVKVHENDSNSPAVFLGNENILLEFSIKDTGIGIPRDKQEHIFERFRQAESHTKRKYGGTGLGLSIAKQLVELQGGTLSVKSEFNVGSVFSFCIPYKKSVEILQLPDITEKKYSMEELSKLNILLVEDNLLNVKLILSLFSEYGLKLQVAENGSVGIEKLRENNFDIILMDMEMPVMNGYEATTIIRKELENNIPIIALTAHAMAGEKEKCLLLGMNDYISKPINPDLLFEKMFSAASNSKNLNDWGREKVVNLNFLINSVSGKKNEILELIDIFLKLIPEDLAVINEAVIRADYLTIKQFSHKMKSSVSVMGISILNPVLDRMEALGTAAKEIEKIKTLCDQLNEICNKAIEELEIEKITYYNLQ